MEYLKSIIPLPKGYLPKVTFAGQQWPVISFTLKMAKPGLRAKASLVIISLPNIIAGDTETNALQHKTFIGF